VSSSFAGLANEKQNKIQSSCSIARNKRSAKYKNYDLFCSKMIAEVLRNSKLEKKVGTLNGKRVRAQDIANNSTY
jgi:hypothetical protein